MRSPLKLIGTFVLALIASCTMAQNKNQNGFTGFIPVDETREFIPVKTVTFNQYSSITADEVPFDQDFYAIVSRPSVPPAASPTASTPPATPATTLSGATPTTITTTTTAPAGGTTTTTITTSAATPPGATSTSAPSTSTATPSTSAPPLPIVPTLIELQRIRYDRKTSINITPVVPRYGSSSSSSPNDQLYIPINRLVPGSTYELRVTWSGPTPQTDTYYFTTSAKELTDRAKARLSAEFGLMAAYFKQSDNLFAENSLCLTVNYHLRPVNKKVPLKNYGLFHLRRFSAVVGVTMNSMAEERIRRNLLGSSNLMAGLSYQPLDMIRISYGGMLFKNIDPNPLFSDKTNLAATPYFSLTLDLDLKDLLGGLLGVLGFK